MQMMNPYFHHLYELLEIDLAGAVVIDLADHCVELIQGGFLGMVAGRRLLAGGAMVRWLNVGTPPNLPELLQHTAQFFGANGAAAVGIEVQKRSSEFQELLFAKNVSRHRAMTGGAAQTDPRVGQGGFTCTPSPPFALNAVPVFPLNLHMN
jgi:hypothetical protein